MVILKQVREIFIPYTNYQIMFARIVVYYILLTTSYFVIAQNKAIHTMFLQEIVPTNGTEVTFNAPILRWPYQKGKQVKYDIQLAQDADFNVNTTLHTEGLLGAVFNPHQSLAIGTWYWRYRVAGKAWSAVNNFKVTPKALSMVSPTASQFLGKIPAEHPRILLNNFDQKLKKQSQTADALAIRAEADMALKQKLLTENDAQPTAVAGEEKQNKKLMSDAVVALGNELNQMVSPLCQAYLLTGKQHYAKKAIDIALEVAKWDAKGISASRDFTDGMCMYDMALVFDTFYDQLTPEQRDVLQKAIKERAEGFYISWVNNMESKVLSGHVWQLLLNEFFKTSLALYQHEPDAAQWLAYAYDLFLARSPVLGGLEGGWAEGAYYFQMNMEVLVDIPNKIKSYTGFDFIKAHPWYTNNANWLVYNFPPASSADGYGDNTEELFEPPASYAAYSEVMAQLTQNTQFSWYAKQMQQVQPIDLSKEPMLRWFRLLNMGVFSIPSGIKTKELPMGYLSKEVGVAALHTNLTQASKDIMLAMRSSPFGAYGHILSDQNTFNILVGGKRLFYRTGYKVAMDDPHRLGWSKHTKSQNGILINGEGQPYSAEAYGYFSRFLQGDQLAYIKGDASNAYQSVETKEDYGLKKFYRHIVLMKQGLVVIYDELEADADAEWSWLIHSLKDMKIDSLHHTFTSTIENAKGIGRLWSSEPLAWQLTNKFAVPAVQYRNYTGMRTKNYVDQWHLKAVNKTKTAKIRFLSIIQISEKGANVLPFKEISETEGITKLTFGDWEIEANLSTDLLPQLRVSSAAHKTSFAAYGDVISFQNQAYKGTKIESSKLVEWTNGKVKFSEMDDEPLAPIR